MTLQFFNSANNSGCALDRAINATLEMRLEQHSDGSVSGTAEAHGTDAIIGGTWEGMAVLAAMREGIAGGVGKPGRRAVNHFRDKRQRLQRPRAGSENGPSINR